MARQKTVHVTYKRVKTPSGKSKMVKTSKDVLKATNVSKGANAGTRPWKSDAAALKSEQISESGRTARANRAALSIDVANVANAAASTAKSIAGSGYNKSMEQVSNGVSQAITGGIHQGSSNRDDDDMSDFVD